MAKDRVGVHGSDEETGRGKPKTKCPVTRAQFDRAAKAIVLDVGGSKVMAQPKEFATGSLGWFVNEKMIVEVDGVPCKVQANIVLTLVGSKEAEAK